jgi:hypothetical protein
MRTKWSRVRAARYTLSAGTIATLAALVGAGVKWH